MNHKENAGAFINYEAIYMMYKISGRLPWSYINSSSLDLLVALGEANENGAYISNAESSG